MSKITIECHDNVKLNLQRIYTQLDAKKYSKDAMNYFCFLS